MAQANLLDDIRKKIDDIDHQIHDLLNVRAKLALQVGQIKVQKAGDLTNFYRPQREAEILKRINEHNIGLLNDHAVANIFQNIMVECLKLQLAQYTNDKE